MREQVLGISARLAENRVAKLVKSGEQSKSASGKEQATTGMQKEKLERNPPP